MSRLTGDPATDAGRNQVTVTSFRDLEARSCSKRELSLDELVELMKKTTRASKKQLPLLKFATFGEQATEKGSLRHDRNITSVCGVELDYDDGEVPVETVLDNLRAANMLAVVCTTASHTPDRPRFRILAPFLRPVGGEFSRMAEARKAALHTVERLAGVRASSESWSSSQSFYYGTVKGGAPLLVEIVPGRHVDTFVTPAASPASSVTTSTMPRPGSPPPPATERLQRLRAGVGLHPTACSLAMRYASKGLDEGEILDILQPQIEQAERDPARLHAMLDGELQDIVASAVRKARRDREEPAAAPRQAIELRHVAEIVAERREPRWFRGLHRILERGVLAVLAGQRGTFKSFIVLDWSMRAAVSGHKVLILSGEGAGLDRRVDAWMRVHGAGVTLADLPIHAIERPLRLTAGGDLAELVEVIEATPATPDLIVIDTLSKYSAGIDENDNAEMAQYLGDLAVGLRDRFDATVLLVAHAGHGDAKRPRGASALMANPDSEFIVERPAPTAMTVTLSRERFKDYASLEPLAYAAEVVDLGRVDSDGDRVTSLALRSTHAPAPKPALTGRVQMTAWTALREWSRQHPDVRNITTPELHELFKVHGIDRRRKLEVTNALVNARALTAAVGGYTLDPEAMTL